MSYDPKFGPAAQTPAQRALVLEQLRSSLPTLHKASAHTQQLYTRYVAGELSWAEVCQAREGAATGRPPQ